MSHVRACKMSQKLCSFQLVNFPSVVEVTNVKEEEDEGMTSHFVRHFAVAR